MRINGNVKQVVIELLFVIGDFICRLIHNRQRERCRERDDDYA